MDVTLGSLLAESLEVLEGMGVLDEEGEEEEEEEEEGQAEGEEEGQSSKDVTMSGAEGQVGRRESLHSVGGRGMPYFESMVEDSRLGRIKRQKGGHTSRDGRTTVQWEVVEIGGEDDGDERAAGSNKRARLDA